MEKEKYMHCTNMNNSINIKEFDDHKKDIISKEIINIITEIGELSESIGLNTRFDEIELDSLKFIAIVVEIERFYKFEFEDENMLLKNYQNISDFVEYVTKKIEEV